MKKINLPPFGLRLFVILFLFLAVHTAWGQEGNWTDYKATGYDSGSGTADKPYIIKTAEQLAYFAARVTSGQDRTACFKLGANIDLSDHFWVPIGKTSTDDGNNFSGTFDGDGNVIKGMNIKWEAASSGNKCYGFFSQLRSGAKVRNIVFKEADIYNEETTDTPNAGADRLFGVLAGMIHGNTNTEIKNIAVHNSTIKAKAPFKQNGKYYVIGGFIGKIRDNNDNCKIANIYIDVDIDFSAMTNITTNKVFIATFISEYQTNVKSSPENLYVKGNITASENLTLIGPVLAKNNPTGSTVKGTWFVESGQQYKNSSTGTALTPSVANQATEVTGDEENFKTLMNAYVASDENLLLWEIKDGKLSLIRTRIHVFSNYDYASHTSKTVEYYVKVTEPDNYNYVWTVGEETKEATPNAQGYSSITVNISNKPVSGQVVVTDKSDATNQFTIPFTIAPKYYSIDLYANEYAGGTGTAADPYLIANDLQLAKLAREVRNGTTYDREFFKLSADIKLTDAYWIPIGNTTLDNANTFKGTLNGDGKTISDMTIRWADATLGSEQCFGLFSTLYTNATVRNLVIDKADVCNTAFAQGVNIGGNRSIGILAGTIKSGTTIENLIIKNSKNHVDATFNQNGKWFGFGGVAGRIVNDDDNYTLSNVYVHADIDVSNAVINNVGNIVIGTVIGEFKSNRKTWPINVYAKGNITAVSGVTKVGPIFGNGIPASTVSDTWFVDNGNTYTDKDGNDLTVLTAKANTGATYTDSQFVSLANKYSNTRSNLYYWQKDEPAFFHILISTSIQEIYDSSTHKSKDVKYYLVIDNPTGYTYEWKLDGVVVPSSADAGNNSYSTVSTTLSNKMLQCAVTLTKDGKSTIVTCEFAPRYYSIDLYDDNYHNGAGDGTKENPYVIGTDLQLAALARYINNSSTKENFAGKYFVLGSDIDLSSALWMPIGSWNNSTELYFYGKFDGKGHTISNMRIEWEGYNGKWNAWGLFAQIGGSTTTPEGFGCITNLILQDAEIHKKAGYQPLGSGINIGIVAGEIKNNSEISNIIIRNSKITDDEEAYSPGMGDNYRIGGIFANIESGVVRVFNISSDVAINMFKNTKINSGNVHIAGGIGRINNGNPNNSLNIYAANIYVHGPEIITNGLANNKLGEVVANTNNPATDNRNTWYYVNSNTVSGTKYNYGTQKSLADFAADFVTANNQFSILNAFDQKEVWAYSETPGFRFSSIEITVERGEKDVATASMPGKEDFTEYYWYLSSDQINWVKQKSTTTNENGETVTTDYKGKTFDVPRKDYNQYVCAGLEDGTRSQSQCVEAIRVTGLLDKSNAPTYTVKINVNIPEWDTLDKIKEYLNVTFQWKLNNNETDNTSDTYTHKGELKLTDRLCCHLTIQTKDGTLTLIDRDLFTSIVVYLKPAKEVASTNDKGETIYILSKADKATENGYIADSEHGYSSDKPMLTWKGAYSKLEEAASWDENVIVLMGPSHYAITNDADYGFNLTNNTSGTGMLNQQHWNEKTKDSPLFRNTTITGKDVVDGTLYTEAIIQMKGGDCGLPIWGDTRFENISFKKNDGSYDIFYCQYNNLEMGEGVKMLDYKNNSPGYGTIGIAHTTSFQVFGGINNDGRFHPLNTKAKNDQMEASLPHGKEGFKMTFKSGHYSTICVGGRQSGNGDYNGMMGTANMPIKCTIEVDIDRGFNDEGTSYTGTMPDFDAGIILAGNHEGAMYGDVDIIVKSGKVGRIVGGTLGNMRGVNSTLNPPYNTYMGRVNILVDPFQSRFYTKGENLVTTNSRIMVTELYGGSCGRGFADNVVVDNPFYGTSTVTINGGTFQRLTKDSKNAGILCGIFGAGAGGMNGIGNDAHPTPDTRIAYMDGDVVKYGNYSTAKGKFAKYNCYNADSHTYTEIDPEKTSTTVIINGGVFGSSKSPMDGVYGGGSGYMATELWTSEGAIPNVNGGNIYGKEGQTVSTLTINGGEFYCTNGVFAGGRGTNSYYEIKAWGAQGATYTKDGVTYTEPTAKDYKKLGQIYGNVEMNITGGTFHCPVFGGGYGVADAKCLKTDGENNNVNTLSDMALITGRSIVRISGGTFYKNVYGGGDMARIVNVGNEATYLEISGNADIRGAVFAAGNGREYRQEATYTQGDNKTKSPELVGKVTGNTNVSFYGTTTQAPYMYGDIFGGGNLAYVNGDTYVNIYAGNFAGEIFGGGNGKLNEETKTVINSADVTGNTSVMLAQDQGGQEEGEGGTLEDQFSINVIWDKLWDSTKEKFYGWAAPVTGVEEGYFDKSKFWDGKKFLNAHNIYGGGKNACVVGTYTTAKNGEPTLNRGTGTATVTVQKGMTPYSLLKTTEWKDSYDDNANPHFYVFGGGYGENTKVGYTEVTVNVEGEYGDYSAEVDDEPMQMARPAAGVNAGIKAAIDPAKLPVFDNSKGIPNFTVLGVLGGGYAGTVTKDAMVTVDGKTFLHRVYGGGFGDPAAADAENTTGQVLGDAKVFVNGAHIYGDVFGGGAGVAPKTPDADPFTKVARVYGKTMVQIGDDARIYGKVYGGGDMACVGPVSYTPNYATMHATMPTSASTLTDGVWTYDADKYCSFVNIIGGDIFGEVYGGGKGLTRASSVKYNQIGRIEGNTLVHIAETPADGSDFALSPDGKTVVPYVWNRIYGGCAYGTVDGNAMVHVEGGMLGLNIFGGGYGDVPIVNDATNESSGASTNSSTLEQVLGKECEETDITSADVLGNTKVLIDGGSWIWNRKADTDGNIITWLDANRQVLADLNAFKDFATRLDSVADLSQMPELQGVESEFFNVTTRSFMKNHNIFGGGNRACKVGKYDNESGAVTSGTGKAEVVINHSPLSKIDNGSGTEISNG